jgi:hypothetical protein
MSKLPQKSQSNIGAVISRFLFMVYFITVSLIIVLLLPITPIYFLATGKNWLEKCAKVAENVSDRLFKNGL